MTLWQTNTYPELRQNSSWRNLEFLPCEVLIRSGMETHDKISGAATQAVVEKLRGTIAGLLIEIHDELYITRLFLQWLSDIKDSADYLLDQINPNGNLPPDIAAKAEELIMEASNVPNGLKAIAQAFHDLQSQYEQLGRIVEEWKKMKEPNQTY